MTTIAVPVRDGRFCSHFGGAEAFALYTVGPAARSVGERRTVIPPEHGRGVFPTWLRSLGAKVVLAGGMGPRAVGILGQHGIEVVLGIEADEPDAVVVRYLDGTLVTAGEPCHEHSLHDCGHHGGAAETTDLEGPPGSTGGEEDDVSLMGRGSGFGHRGSGAGSRGGGMGAAGDCLCPKCGRRQPHRAGVPCREERCPECGAALVREGSPHHQAILDSSGDAAVE